MVIIHLIWRCRQQTTKDLTMKLELPDNNASVLYHMGNALQSIARDIDTTLPVNGHTETVGDVSRSVTVEPLVDDNVDYVKSVIQDCLDDNAAITTDAEQYGKSLVDFDEIASEIPEANDTIDADGLPWDSRIHSRGKTRLDDNTWRMARKPKDKNDAEWAEYVEGVKTELKALMVIPVAAVDVGTNVKLDSDKGLVGCRDCDGSGLYYQMEDTPCHCVDVVVTPPVVDVVVTPPVDAAVVTPPVDAAVVTPPVVDAVVTPPVVDAVVTPPVDAAVVTPPVDAAVVTPPVDAAVVTGPTTFPELMKFITVNNKKLTKESIDEALKAQGLASIALLAARTDLIPQVHAALVKLL